MKGPGLIFDMLQMLFGYRHYDYRKCPTPLVVSLYGDFTKHGKLVNLLPFEGEVLVG